jgi:hypothetical protein
MECSQPSMAKAEMGSLRGWGQARRWGQGFLVTTVNEGRERCLGQCKACQTTKTVP